MPKPASFPDDCRSVVIKNIPYKIGEEQLFALLCEKGFPAHESLNIPKSKQGIYHRGYAFISFSTTAEAKSFTRFMSGYSFPDYPSQAITVFPARRECAAPSTQASNDQRAPPDFGVLVTSAEPDKSDAIDPYEEEHGSLIARLLLKEDGDDGKHSSKRRRLTDPSSEEDPFLDASEDEVDDDFDGECNREQELEPAPETVATSVTSQLHDNESKRPDLRRQRHERTTLQNPVIVPPPKNLVVAPPPKVVMPPPKTVIPLVKVVMPPPKRGSSSATVPHTASAKGKKKQKRQAMLPKAGRPSRPRDVLPPRRPPKGPRILRDELRDATHGAPAIVVPPPPVPPGVWLPPIRHRHGQPIVAAPPPKAAVAQSQKVRLFPMSLKKRKRLPVAPEGSRPRRPPNTVPPPPPTKLRHLPGGGQTAGEAWPRYGSMPGLGYGPMNTRQHAQAIGPMPPPKHPPAHLLPPGVFHSDMPPGNWSHGDYYKGNGNDGVFKAGQHAHNVKPSYYKGKDQDGKDKIWQQASKVKPTYYKVNDDDDTAKARQQASKAKPSARRPQPSSKFD